jgi:LysR family transcriptional regulator, hca operon transcriptional activator
MELRHLRYFIAVAEAGSLTVAAEKKLHTAQPSLSRQIRDLEYEVGVQLMTRSVHGIELTAAGRAFLDHARLALTQAEAAAEAARRTTRESRTLLSSSRLAGERSPLASASLTANNTFGGFWERLWKNLASSPASACRSATWARC